MRKRAVRWCGVITLALVGLLVFGALGDGRLGYIISRLRNRHSVSSGDSILTRFWTRRSLDIRPCCMATRDMTLDAFLEQSNQCEERVLVEVKLACGCEEVIACKMIVITAFSDDHFEEAKDFLGSMQTHMPLTNVLVYNLNLSEDKRDYLNSLCNIEVVDFDFSKYPDFISDLNKYSWKPLIVNEVASQGTYEVVMWCDASCRLHQPLYPILPRLIKYHLIPGPTSHLTFISTVHEGMKKYLNVKQNRSELAKLGSSLQANAIILWSCEKFRKKFLDHWVDCALHEECISPEGAQTDHCTMFHMVEGQYMNCHRYDQAAYNSILTREYGMEFMKRIKDWDRDIRNYLTIFRDVSHLYGLVTNCPL